jgi:hypothetical protein
MQDGLSPESGSDTRLKPDDGSDPSQMLFELTLFSTTIFVFSALLLRFLMNLQTAVFLKIYSIHFQYRLFDIRFLTADSTKWPIERILLVFGLGYLVFSIAGVILLVVLRKSHNLDWKIRLTITWIAFLLANSFFAGIIAGVLFYTGFGVAFQWLIGNIIIRSLIAAGALGMMILFKPFWVFLFLKTSPRRMFLKDDEQQKQYFQNVFFKSWLWGFIILLLFNLPLYDGFWPVFLLSLGFIAIPLFDRPVLYDNLFIRKSEKKIFFSRYALISLFVILLIIRISGSFSIGF